MTGDRSSARALRELIVHRIASGTYPVGARLPGTRELSVEVGANRNTVAKVYRALAGDGILRLVRGRGAYVCAEATVADAREPRQQVARLLNDAVSIARLFGLGQGELRQLVEECIAATYSSRAPRLAFVECNPYEAQRAASELSAQLGTAVEPLLVADVQKQDRGVNSFALIATSFFHLGEVERALAGAPVAIVGVNTLPDPEALQRIARLPRGTRVGVVAGSEAGLQRLSGVVRTYSRARLRTLVGPSGSELAELAAWAEVLVVSPFATPRVRALLPEAPIITLSFHVDPQSVQQLRGRLAGIRERLVS